MNKEKVENISLLDILNQFKESQNTLSSRVLGLDMCIKGLALISILDGGSYEDKLRKGQLLKETLNSLQEGIKEAEFMKDVDADAFFSTVNSLNNAIDNLISQIKSLLEAKNESSEQ